VVTLAESLSAAGWATGGFVDGGYLSRGFGLGQGFTDYDDRAGGLADIGPKALGWLRDHAAEPFLLFVHTYDVHTPYAPPEPYRGMFLDGLAPPTPGFEPTSEQMEAIRESRWSDHPLEMAPQDLAYALALYDAGIRYVDDWVATLVGEIDRLGLADRVVVVVISDHGEEFLEHGSVLHEKLYATVTRVPLILRVPGRPGGVAVPDVVETIDLMPTLLELAGVAPPPAAQGRSLLPMVDRRPGEARRAAAEPGPSGEWAAFSESPWFGKQRAVTKGRYRLIYSLASARTELYDIGSDPFEQHDLVETMPARVSELRRALAGWRDRVQATVVAGERSRIDQETREQLKALGYLK
jgi:arylsulfatase A-like enzyme